MRTATVIALLCLAGVSIAACSQEAATSLRTSKSKNQPKFGNNDDDVTSAKCTKDKGNYDVPGDNCDNDADGTVDNPPSCDQSSGNGAEDFAHAMGICQTVAKDGYGLVSAQFTKGFGVATAANDGQHGVLPKFGDVTRPTEGAQLGILSTGFAQEFNGGAGASFSNGKAGSGFGGGVSASGSEGGLPPGFPKAAEGCPQSSDVHDVIDLKLTLKAPKNATGIKFDFNFHSSEWPTFICSSFNDGFLAYLNAKGFNGGQPDNISFDAKKNPVSVNNGFFDRCTQNATTGCSGNRTQVAECAAGPNELSGTGFGLLGTGCDGQSVTSGGATGWLSSQAPVTAGETFTLDFIIWDTGDGDLDSTVLLDNFRWVGGKVETSTERPVVK